MTSISVLLPTYNESDCIESALESLSEQTVDDFEVLVIDDGSTDGTREIVENFWDERVRLIKRDRSGLPSALNRGIRESNGTYIARQDADDLSVPDRLERQRAFLDARDGYGIVGTGAYVVTNDDKRRRRVLEEPTLDDLYSGNRFIHGSVMMRADAVKSVGGYDEIFEYTEDYDLWIRLSEDWKVGNIDEPLYILKLRDESIYGSVLRSVKLYGKYAVMRSKSETSPDLDREIESGNIKAVYKHLSRKEKSEFHRELSMELLRYRSYDKSRPEIKQSFIKKPGILPLILMILSYSPENILRTAIDRYRCLKNIQISRKNQKIIPDST